METTTELWAYLIQHFPEVFWRFAAPVIAAGVIAGLGFFTIRLKEHLLLFRYVRALPSVYSFRRFSISERAPHYDYLPRWKLRELTRQKKPILFTGEAGVGKTSLLITRLEIYCKETSKWNYLWTRIPVVVKMTTIQKCLSESSHDSLVEMVSVALRAAGVIKRSAEQTSTLAARLVTRGKCLFLIDDIDQMDAACTQKLTHILADELERSANRFILGCRLSSYELDLRGTWRKMRLAHDVYVLTPMNIDQIQRFQQIIASEMIELGLRDVADRLSKIMSNPDVASLCRQPLYLALLLKLLEDGVNVETARISPHYLVDRASRHLVSRHHSALTRDSTSDFGAPVVAEVVFPIIGYLAYTGYIPGGAPGPMLTREIRSALNAINLLEFSESARQMERLISNSGVVAPRPVSEQAIDKEHELVFVHSIFKDYFISRYCNNDPQRLLAYIGQDASRGRHLVPFWVASSSSAALVQLVEQARNGFPFLVALCLQTPEQIPPAIREEVAATARVYIDPKQYNSDIAERYTSFACWERSREMPTRFNDITQRIGSMLRQEANETRSGEEQKQKSHDTHLTVGDRSTADDLFRCVVLAIDDEAAEYVVPFALYYRDLRKYGAWAPAQFLTVYKKYLYRGAASAYLDSLSRLNLPPITELDIVDSALEVGTVSAIEMMLQFLNQTRFQILAVAALMPAFGSNDAARQALELDCGAPLSDGEFGWLFVPLINGAASETLAANTTRFVRLLLQNLTHKHLETRILSTPIGAGLLAIHFGPNLVRLFKSDGLFEREMRRLVSDYTFARTSDQKDEVHSRMMQILRRVDHTIASFCCHVSRDVLAEVLRRLMELDDTPTSALWGANISNEVRPALADLEEYKPLPISGHIGTALSALSAGAGIVLGGNVFLALPILFYLGLGWWSFARDPARLPRDYSSVDTIPIKAIPVLGLPLLIAGTLVTRILIVLEVVAGIFGFQSHAFRLIEIYYEKADHHIVWLISCGCGIWFGSRQALGPDAGVELGIAYVVAVSTLQALIFFRIWRRFVCFQSPLSGLLTSDGGIAPSLRLH